MTTTLTNFDDNAHHIARRQYLQHTDGDISGMFRRIANWVAGAEHESVRPHWAQKYYDLMAEKKFCPGGRVLAGAGTQHGNVLNCFVQGATQHDPSSFEGIMEVARKLALVTKVGGGNGLNLDVIKPQTKTSRSDYKGTATLSAYHPDAMTFVRALMTPSNQSDGPKVPVTLTNFSRALIYDPARPISEELQLACLEEQVLLMTTDEAFQTFEVSQDTVIIRSPDDLGGIIDAARTMALEATTGNRVVLQLDDMRAEGAPIKGSGGTSSGPFSFLVEIFDNFLEWANRGAEASGPINTLRFVYAPVLRVVRQGGTRRGAGMATISVDNAHILDFLTAKDLDREAAEGDISTFNISILITREFMEDLAINNSIFVDALICPPGKYDRSDLETQGFLTDSENDSSCRLHAKWLWKEVAQHAWSTGEPGLIFIDRVNEYSALKNLGKRYEIRSTNPCLAPGTDVMYRETGSDHGPHTALVETLLDRDVEVIDGVNGQWYPTRFKVTGRNETVWNLETDLGGTDYFTPYHTFFRADGTPAELRELEVGEKLLGGNGTLHTVYAVGTDTRTEAEVYCCTVHPHHRFMLASGLLSGNCGEIPLTVGEPCDLGAINLAAYVKDSRFDYATFRADVRTTVRFLDDVLDVNVFALEDNRVASSELRRLGLGVMGLADMLIKLGLRYDSDAGRDVIYDIMSALREEAIAESEKLGQERGVYPVYARHADKIPHTPRRNVAVLTVAPTGTTSMLMGVSSGIEPVFSPFIWRKIGSEYRALLAPLFVELLEAHPVPDGMQDAQGHWNWDKVTEAVSENHGSVVGLPFIPDALQQVFVCAHDIKPADHVRMQGTVQRAFDAEGFAANSLSKTINLPNSATVQDVQDAYSEAYRTGCKGITVYRDGSRQFQVLSTSKAKDQTTAEPAEPTSTDATPAPEPTPTPAAVTPDQPKARYERPARLSGVTDMVKLTDPTSGHRRSFLVTVNHLGGQPVEVMVISGRAGDEANADSEALGRIVSIALQHGVPVQAIIKTLRGINGGLYGSYNGRLVGSKADLIAVALETFQKDMDAAQLPPLAGGSGDAPAPTITAPSGVSVDSMDTMSRDRCPVCEQRAVIREEGCLKCQACGYSKCGG